MAEAADQARQQAQAGAEKARGALRTQVDQRSTQAGQQITQQVSDVRTVAQQLREQGKEGPAKVAEQAAQRVERVGNYLERSDGDRILRDVENAARSNPWAVVLGGLAVGFAASRMLKASSGTRAQQAYQDGGGYRGQYADYGRGTSPYRTGAGLSVGGSAYEDREPATGRTVPAVQPASAPPVPAAPVPVGTDPVERGTDPVERRTGEGQWSG
jgi:hypothetical protein